MPTILLLPLLLSSAPPQDEDIRPSELKRIEELREEVRMLALFEQAKLTKEQAASLLDIIGKAAEALQELVARHQDRIAEAKELLEECRTLLAKGEPLTGELRERFETLQRGAGEMQQALGRQVAPLLGDLRGVLSDEQVQILAASTRPDVWGPFRQQLEQGIRQVRQLSDDDFELHVPDLLDQQLERIAERFGAKLNEDEYLAENKRIMKLLRDARKLDDEELRGKSGSLVSKILGDGKLGEFARKAGQGQAGGAGAGSEQGLGKLLFNPIAIRALKARRDE
jgi:hypothetical protein